MKASAARRRPAEQRLLVVDAERGSIRQRLATHLAAELAPGDLLVVNDATTLPASLSVRNFPLEMRLAQRGARDGEFWAVAFGPGDYRTPTELRAAPAPLVPGQRLEFDDELSARVLDVDPRTPRLVRLGFSPTGARLFMALYRLGRPIQYAHVPEPLALWDVQNRFAGRPWAFEAPSAGFALDAEQLAALASRGVGLARVTHAAGLSATGSAELDARLPLPERYEVPAETAARVRSARQAGTRIVAVGTSVVRALESSALDSGDVRPGRSITELLLGPSTRRRVVDGVLSGMHESGTSHFSLLEAFANRELLLRALAVAETAGYEAHEFGDACLILNPLGTGAVKLRAG